MYSSIILGFIGIAMLILGIFTMRFGLKKMLWTRLKNLLMTSSITPWRGLFIGIIASAVVQGSTAISLITIGLVSAEYLSFYQGLGIILGANIGTCSTVQLMSLPLLEQLNYPIIFALLGLGLIIKKFRYLAISFAGIFSMFLGLNILYKFLSTITSVDSMLIFLTINNYNPVYSIMCGIITTFIVQSSSAVTGILMVLANQGLLDLTTAAYIVYGNNIGSCLSSLLVGAASPIAAKRLAMAHFALNILGVMIFFPITGLLTSVVSGMSADFGWQVAMLHTIFNVLSSLLIMPVIKQYGNFIAFLIPETTKR